MKESPSTAHAPWTILESNCKLYARIKALRSVGVPYREGYENGPAQKELEAQALKVVENLKVGSVTARTNREIIAVIAYLQRLGTDIKGAVPAPTTPAVK